LLYSSPGSLRVVAFEGNKLEYKPGLYDVGSERWNLKIFDLDNDQKLEFIGDEWFPPTRVALQWVTVPRIKHWDPQNGFSDVSKKFPEYYRTVVFPELRRRAQEDVEKQKLYLDAIKSIETDITQVR
jgi:hypothetical protein